MALQLLGPINRLSLPRIDQARQATEMNALAIDSTKEQMGDADRIKSSKLMLGMSKLALEGLNSDPGWYAKMHPKIFQHYQSMGWPTEGMPGPDTPVDKLIQDFSGMGQAAMMALSDQPQADPKLVRDAAGYMRDVRTGERPPGFADVEKPPPQGTLNQRDFEYGQQNPAFAEYIRKKASSSGARPSSVDEYEYYIGLDEEAQKEYLKVKRGEKGPSSSLEARLFDVNDKAFDARSKANQYEKLADNLIQVDPESGKVAEWTENLKALTGNEDAVTLLRKNWNNLRVGAAVQNLPPGVASDKDIELVMSAFLPEFANPETVASFMRGLAKLEAIKAEYHEFESDYLSKHGTAVGLSKAWREALLKVDTAGVDVEVELQQAREALESGKSRAAIEQMLQSKGIDPRQL